LASDLHDRDIREPLFEFLEDSFGKIRILEEKTMGRSRADIEEIARFLAHDVLRRVNQ